MFIHTKCLFCVGIEPATSCAAGAYSDYCAIGWTNALYAAALVFPYRT
jgi:hypothetical protein